MDIITIIVLAIGLSMDSLAIALTSGAIIKNHRLINVLKIAGMLAFVQMVLTIIGWLVGRSFVDYIDQYDHWIAFSILVFLGIRVIRDELRNKDEDIEVRPFNPLNIKTMFTLSVATSIDAMAVGLSISLVGIQITVPALVVGIVTFCVGILGVVFGSKASRRYKLSINIIGGLILIAIGITILLDHTVFASEDSILAIL
ncbi:manganese efflux pump MntP [Dysgonomonas massiliensis]|uniref:manganese efflux pump MntP n=1 Tax=Dysgonomonas massiliensis TaxID=2040292 RepID=UPI000C78A4F4|nr:manganese efflux pump MntP family protein [Dysgonomonas massiliensis]